MWNPITLAPGWWCLEEKPPTHPGWGASPIFVEDVQVLEPAEGRLRLRYVQLLAPRAATMREVVMVGVRAPDEFVGVVEEVGEPRVLRITPPDAAWLRQHMPPPVRVWNFADSQATSEDVEPDPCRTPRGYLAFHFGRTASEAYWAGHAAACGVTDPHMPAERATFRFDRSYGPRESWMIARGRKPDGFDVRWVVCHLNGRLLFFNSWTGKLTGTWR